MSKNHNRIYNLMPRLLEHYGSDHFITPWCMEAASLIQHLLTHIVEKKMISEKLQIRINDLMPQLMEENSNLSTEAFSLIEDLVLEVEKLQSYIDEKEPELFGDI